MKFLQIVADTVPATGSISGESLSVIDLAIRGGFMMIPITILGLLAIYLFIERVMFVNKAARDPDAFMDSIKELVFRSDIDAAKAFCIDVNTPVARMIERGISRIGNPLKSIEASIENVAKGEVFKLEKNLATLATIAGAAPMLGFLGTVIGLVEAFMAISQERGTMSPKLLSSGIYTAMITTVAGLIVGIIAYLGYNYLVSKVQHLAHKMEYTAADFIDLLQEPR